MARKQLPTGATDKEVAAYEAFQDVLMEIEKARAILKALADAPTLDARGMVKTQSDALSRINEATHQAMAKLEAS